MPELLQEIRSLSQSPRALRGFGILVGAVLIILASLVWHLRMPAITLAVAGILLATLGAAAPRLLSIPYRLLDVPCPRLGLRYDTPPANGCIFLLITPVGLLMRLTGRDPMRRKLDPEAPTYWIPKVDQSDPKERLKGAILAALNQKPTMHPPATGSRGGCTHRPDRGPIQDGHLPPPLPRIDQGGFGWQAKEWDGYLHALVKVVSAPVRTAYKYSRATASRKREDTKIFGKAPPRYLQREYYRCIQAVRGADDKDLAP